MLVGHLAAGLLFKRLRREVNLGVYFTAALLPDILLWVFILMGFESLHVPADFASKHYYTFTFPFSHSLAADLFWALLAGIFVYKKLAWDYLEAGKAGFAVGAAVMSNFVLDALVIVPGMPLVGPNSGKIGLGLWNSMPVAIGIEIVLAIIGLIIYLKGTKRRLLKRIVISTVMVILMIFAITLPYRSTVPLSPDFIAVWELIAFLIVISTGFWVDGRFSLKAAT